MNPGQSPTLLRLDAVACVRGGRVLFAGLSVSVAAGDCIWLRGANGIGKSSLLRQMAGLLPIFDGNITRTAPPALLDDRIAMELGVSVRQNLVHWATLDRASAETIAHARSAMGIDHLADIPLRYCSTGQRKRVQIARVIASGAALWLLDEPTNGLDDDGVARLAAAISAHRSGGGAVVIASHIDLALPDVRVITLGDYAATEDA